MRDQRTDRRTKVELLEKIAELENDVAMAETENDRILFELEADRRSRMHLRELLDRADAEVVFLRSIVHGLVPESLIRSEMNRLERRMKKIVDRLDAESLSISIEWDSGKAWSRPGHWTADLVWYPRGWRNGREQRAAHGYAPTLEGAIRDLEREVDGTLFRDRTTEEVPEHG